MSTKFLISGLFSLLCLVMQACAASPSAITFSQRGEYWGATDQQGKVIVPFKYDYVESLHNGYTLVMKASTDKNGDSLKHVGVMDNYGHWLVPPRYSGIDFYSDKQRFKVAIGGTDTPYKMGYLDTQGHVVVPVIYDELERISNIGEEPTNIAKRNGKYGYINIINGKILIPVQYDMLDIDSLNVDHFGQGQVIARKNNKWGVLRTDGSTLVPFEFDYIDELSVFHGTALAEQNGEMLQLNFKNTAYVGTSPVPPIYSSDFVPRGGPSINSMSFDGMYVAEQYDTMALAWQAKRAGILQWAAIPSIEIRNDHAFVSFGLFRKARLPMLRNIMSVSRRPDGFSVMTEVDDGEPGKTVSTKLISFTRRGDAWLCNECARINLPVRWRLVATEKPVAFGGIGIALNKGKTSPIQVLEVLHDGPAERAGIKAGDLIVTIDEQEVKDLDADTVRDLLRGTVGSRVKLTIVREGQPLSQAISVERAVIKLR